MNFHERIPQKGKYNLYYSFGKGYINEVRALREHYGAVSSFTKHRPAYFNEEIPEKNHTLNQTANSFKSAKSEENLNKSRNFDKFLRKEANIPEKSPDNFPYKNPDNLPYKNPDNFPYKNPDNFPSKNPDNFSDKPENFNEKPDKTLSKDDKIDKMTLSSSLKQGNSLIKIRFGSSIRKERFENFSLLKKLDFPSAYTDINYMVTGDNQNNDKAGAFYEKNFSLKPKPNIPVSSHNLSNSMEKNMDKLTTPREKRQEIAEILRNNQKYRDWKREMMDSQKKYRITKGKNKQKEMGKIVINSRHRKQLADYTKTNENIDFFKRKNGEKRDKFTDNGENTVKNTDKISSDWTGKARNKEKFMRDSLETHDRLFGAIPNKYSVKRAENLMDCENKGKNWDIISWKVSDVQLKVDKGIIAYK